MRKKKLENFSQSLKKMPIPDFIKMTQDYSMDKPWWQVIEKYFGHLNLAAHQINSYNIFMLEKLPDIIMGSEVSFKKDGVTYLLTFENLKISKPTILETNGASRKIYPFECHLRNLSYMCKLKFDILKNTINDQGIVTETKSIPNILLGEIPCMVQSHFCNLHGENKVKNNECEMDPGGYFYINGQQKVLMSQDRMAHNEIFVFKCKNKGTIRLPLKTDKEKFFTIPCAWSAEVRSFSNQVEPNISTVYIWYTDQRLERGEDHYLYVELPLFKNPVPLLYLFFALGATSIKDICNYICPETDEKMLKLLNPSIGQFEYDDMTSDDAINVLSESTNPAEVKDKISSVYKMMDEKLFQNLPNRQLKLYYLGQMTSQLLSTVLGRRQQDDRDHYAKKRIEAAGNLINNLFKSIWKIILKDAKIQMEKKRTDISQLFTNKITSRLKGPFNTGIWTAQKSTMNQKTAKIGISQALNQHNYISMLSNLRRICTPSDKNSKITKPRHLHNSQWPVICPAETPEGQTAGLIRNLSMLAYVSLGVPDETIIDWLSIKSDLATMIDTITPVETQDQTRIHVNGSWYAVTRKPNKLVKFLRMLRRSGKINKEVSISISQEGVRILTEEGRLMAPYFIIENGQLPQLPTEAFTWDTLLEKQIIEYLDQSELETLYVSEFPWKIEKDHTHSILHPCLMLGISASTIPFPDHNQSPRNCYQSAMGKQALGIYASNFLLRFDTSAHILCYPQKRIVNTKVMKLTNTDNLPSGQNLIVAVKSNGYNQEDSVVVNKRAIDNGALRSINYTTYTESNYRKGSSVNEIYRPQANELSNTRSIKGYKKMESDGIPREAIPVEKKDVVISKIKKSTNVLKDSSAIIKSNGLEENCILETPEGYTVTRDYSSVDRSIVTLNSDGFKMAKVRIRQVRIPQIGDKVASCSAQKGIIGQIVQPEDMPFSELTGMSPDIIMNPHAYPSRMTIGQSLEALLGKVCSITGNYGDCTPFEPEYCEEYLYAELEANGFIHDGDEVMIDGMTGERMPCRIYVGPTYYQRLKHMVDDKIHARDQNGPRETLTRQPVEGRRRGGGFRMGEMETWCGISHGASRFLIDRLMNNSDGYEMHVCDNCGNVAIANNRENSYYCKQCQQNNAISKIRLPYACKLLFQLLQATGIGVWYNIDKTKTLLPCTTQSK